MNLITFDGRLNLQSPTRTEDSLVRDESARFAEANVTESIASVLSTSKSLVTSSQAKMST